MDDPEVKARLTKAYLKGHPDISSQEKWHKTYQRWEQSLSMRSFFPRSDDVYVDGGAIDNTPSNSAIDATREWAEAEGISIRDLDLDLYVVFLDPEPTIEKDETGDPTLHQVVSRTLKIQGAAKRSSDAVVVDTINTFGRRAEILGDALTLVLENYQKTLENLDPAAKTQALKTIQQDFNESGLRGWSTDKGGDEVLEQINEKSKKIRDKLPLQINRVRIFPEMMKMSTLQFTERMGYKQKNAIQMLTSGCYNTLWSIFQHLAANKKPLDGADIPVFALTLKWMGIPEDPDKRLPMDTIREQWQCQRTSCVFYPGFCLKSPLSDIPPG